MVGAMFDDHLQLAQHVGRILCMFLHGCALYPLLLQSAELFFAAHWCPRHPLSWHSHCLEHLLIQSSSVGRSSLVATQQFQRFRRTPVDDGQATKTAGGW